MLEKPPLPDERIASCLGPAYGIQVSQIEFLPIGADPNSFLYRVEAVYGQHYFLKLRSGEFNPAALTVPHLLIDCGIEAIIAPIATRTRALWTHLGGYLVSLYPFIDGYSGVERPLTDVQWRTLGAAVQRIHSVALPEALRHSVPSESLDARWRTAVRRLQTRAENTVFADRAAAQCAALWRAKSEDITYLVERSDQLAHGLAARPRPLVLCHADLHAWNVITTAEGRLYIIDWDTLIFAPKERDLMFIGAGIGGVWQNPHEATLFYQGYGDVEIDDQALANYRLERVVEDLAVYGEQLLETNEGGADRALAVENAAVLFPAQRGCGAGPRHRCEWVTLGRGKYDGRRVTLIPRPTFELAAAATDGC